MNFCLKPQTTNMSVKPDLGLAVAFARQKLAHSSFLPFYFRVCAFSIQRTRLSWSLKQARCPAVSDSWQGKFATKNCTASTFKGTK